MTINSQFGATNAPKPYKQSLCQLEKRNEISEEGG